MTTSSQIQPKTVQKLVIRTVVGLFIVAALFAGYSFLRGQKDIDLPAEFDSEGYLAAVQMRGNGTQAVLISPDGNIVPSPGYVEGARDQDVAWRPDGNRLFFVSDRDERVFHMYRWNPAAPRAERRTFGSQGFGNPTFDWSEDGDGINPLAVSSGRVVELDPSRGAVKQILPPLIGKQDYTEETTNEQSPFDRFYRGVGRSFKSARWVKGRRYIAAVMRGDDNETLIVQPMEPLPDGRMQQPAVLAIGDRVDFDVDPDSGIIVFSANNTRATTKTEVTREDWESGRIEELKQGGREMPKHMLGMIQLEQPIGGPIAVAVSDEDVPSNPAISPDGTKVAITAGEYLGDGNFEMKGLYTLAALPNSGNTIKLVATGNIREVVWNSTGSKLAYVTVLEDGTREIHTVNADGTNDVALTAGKGDFSQPRFSPQG